MILIKRETFSDIHFFICKRYACVMYNQTAAALAIVLIVIFVVILILAAVREHRRRSPPDENGSNEGFNSGLKPIGRNLDCTRMDRHVMRSTPACGLNLPHTTTGKLCVDDACLDARAIHSLVNIPSKVQNNISTLKAEFDQLHERLDEISDHSNKDRISKLSEQISGVKDAIRAIEGVDARGGDKVYEFDGYRVHVFKTSGHFHAKNGGQVKVMVVGGGGGSGGDQAGGGGGGGVIISDVAVRSGASIAVTVGKGGVARSRPRPGGNGDDSSFMDIVAYGGGGGGSLGSDGKDGGSGGGAGSNWSGNSGSGGKSTQIDGWGNDGASGTRNGGQGGGGATQSGSRSSGRDGGSGGDGYDASSLFGISVGEKGWFAGGGGGGDSAGSSKSGTGGKGGGGGRNKSKPSGLDGTGGGAQGGDRGRNVSGHEGGSGVVIIRYAMGNNRDAGALDGMGSMRGNKPVAAYSLRRLFGSYAGPQLRIRRSSDNKEANVYFDKNGRVTLIKAENGETSESLEQWTKDVTTATVEIWFDQSGNGKHMSESTRSRNNQTNPAIGKHAGYYVLHFNKDAGHNRGTDSMVCPVNLSGRYSVIYTGRYSAFVRAHNRRSRVLNSADSNNIIGYYRGRRDCLYLRNNPDWLGRGMGRTEEGRLDGATPEDKMRNQLYSLSVNPSHIRYWRSNREDVDASPGQDGPPGQLYSNPSTNFGRVVVGGRGRNDQPSDCQIRDLILFDTDLDLAPIKSIEGALARHWL